MGDSRVRKAVSLYHYDLIRRSDWLPVGGDETTEHIHRSVDSMSDSNDRDDDASEDSSNDSDSDAPENYSGDEEFQNMLERLEPAVDRNDEWDALFDPNDT